MQKALIMLIVFFMIVSCGTETASNKKYVVSTTSIVTDIVSQVAGDKMEVRGIIGIGENSHSFEPGARLLAEIEGAQLVFVNGFGLEEKLMTVLPDNAPVVELSTGVNVIAGGHDHEEHDDDHEEEDHDEEDHDEEDHDEEDHDEEDHDEEDHDVDEHDEHELDAHGIDPHSWTSIPNVLLWVENARDALAGIDPDNAAYYVERAHEYSQELIELDTWARAELNKIEHDRRVIIADHQVFGYFADAYDFENPAAIVPSFSTNADTSARQLAELIHIIEDHEVKALFLSETAGNSVDMLVKAIESELGYKIKVLNLLAGSLSADADTYVKYFKYNVNQLVQGLAE